MAVSIANVGDTAYKIVGSRKQTVNDVTMDSSYPTGGETVTAANLGLNRVEWADAVVKSATGGGENVANASYVPASGGNTGQLLVYNETPAEAGNATDLSTTVIRVTAYGY